MSEERLERIENHMVQLIQMVAQNNESMNRLEQRIEKLEERMVALEHRMDGLEHRLDALEQRMDALEQRMDALEQRFDKLEQRMDAESALNTKRHLEILQQFRHVNADISYLDELVAKHEQELKK
jgi:predicted  nucleic acid-binding Zn-ribbon protein